jgi:hypothetical protein
MGENLCLSCGKADSEGLSILGAYLCGECESKLIKSTVATDDYQHWVTSCRKLWEDIKTKLGEIKE